MDDTAHRAALGTALADPDLAWLLIEHCEPDDFAPGWMQNTYLAIAECYTAGIETTPQAVLAQLQASGRIRPSDGGIGPFLADLYQQAPFPTDIEGNISLILEQSYRRRVWAATTRMRQGCTEWPMAALLATVDREFAALIDEHARRTRPAAQPATAPTRGIPGLSHILDGYTPESPAA